MFTVFDKNHDGYIDREEFKFCWNNWIKIVIHPLTFQPHSSGFTLNKYFKQIVRPINAFLVVDAQNDFISGSLNLSNCSAQHNGHDVSLHIIEK